MSEVKFTLKAVDKRRSRRYRKGSKYDPILDTFLGGVNNLVEVNVSGKDADYLRIQLDKRIKAKSLGGVRVSVVNDTCYLEKV